MLSKEEIAGTMINYLNSNRKLFNIGPETEIGFQTHLFGNQGILDSISLVHLIVFLEKNIKSHKAQKITIASSKAMSSTQGPFRSVESLTNFIDERVRE